MATYYKRYVSRKQKAAGMESRVNLLEKERHMIDFQLLHPRMTVDHLGYIPHWLSVDNPKPAKEQIHDNYTHGGGWHPFKGFRMSIDGKYTLYYPGDPQKFSPLAKAQLRDETILFYRSAYVCIVQKDGTFEVARID
jgi:hypothetical protein